MLGLALLAQMAAPRAAPMLGLIGHGLSALVYGVMIVDTVIEVGSASLITCVILAILAIVSGQQALELWQHVRRGSGGAIQMTETGPNG